MAKIRKIYFNISSSIFAHKYPRNLTGLWGHKLPVMISSGDLELPQQHLAYSVVAKELSHIPGTVLSQYSRAIQVDVPVVKSALHYANRLDFISLHKSRVRWGTLRI